MKLVKMQWTEGRTMNMGDRNFVRVEFGVEAQLDPDEDPVAGRLELKHMVREVIEDECGELLAIKKAAR